MNPGTPQQQAAMDAHQRRVAAWKAEQARQARLADPSRDASVINAPARPRRAPEGLSRLTAPNPSAPGVARAPNQNGGRPPFCLPPAIKG